MHTVYIVQVTRPDAVVLDSAWPTQDAALSRVFDAAKLHNVSAERVTVEHVPFEDSWA